MQHLFEEETKFPQFFLPPEQILSCYICLQATFASLFLQHIFSFILWMNLKNVFIEKCFKTQKYKYETSCGLLAHSLPCSHLLWTISQQTCNLTTTRSGFYGNLQLWEKWKNLWNQKSVQDQTHAIVMSNKQEATKINHNHFYFIQWALFSKLTQYRSSSNQTLYWNKNIYWLSSNMYLLSNEEVLPIIFAKGQDNVSLGKDQGEARNILFHNGKSNCRKD